MKLYRMHSAKIILFILIQLMSVHCVYAQQEDIRPVILDEFIKEVCRQDTVFQEILIDELKLTYEKSLKLPAGDLVVSVESQYDFLFDPDDKDLENTVSLSKLFPYIGTDIEAEYSSSLARSTRKVTSDFAVTITQPIAENAFGRNTRLLDKIVGIEVDVAKHQIIEAYEDYLASLIQLYYDWYSAFENLKTGKASYDENMTLLENMKEREKNKIALPIDVNKINLQVVAKRENLISLEEQYAEYLNLVRQALRYGGNDTLQPQRPSLYTAAEIDFERDYERFRTLSRTSGVLNLLEEKSEVEVNRYADELLPSIDLFAGYFIEGDRHIIEKSDKMLYVGATLDWPFPGQVEIGNYETSKIDRDKAKLSSQNTHIKLHTNLKNLHIRIIKEKRLISIAEEKIKLAQAIVVDETENYSLGRASLNDLIDEINKLEDNKFNKISHEIQLKKLIVEWLRLTDTLVSKNDISDAQNVPN